MLISDVVLLASRLYIYHYHTRAAISVTPASHQHYPVGSIGQQIEKKITIILAAKPENFMHSIRWRVHHWVVVVRPFAMPFSVLRWVNIQNSGSKEPMLARALQPNVCAQINNFHSRSSHGHPGRVSVFVLAIVTHRNWNETMVRSCVVFVAREPAPLCKHAPNHFFFLLLVGL